ncbi:MAG: hypothetical protein JO214_14670 [Frankiaceae bacterium]|nr:hypothetical protein [Frankiaceae bacterium]
MAGDSGGGHGATTGVWIAVAVIIAGSIIGGIALIEWVWPVFWVGVGLMVLGTVGAYLADIMDMVSEFGSGDGPAEAESA